MPTAAPTRPSRTGRADLVVLGIEVALVAAAVIVALDRIGVGGGGPAALLCVLVGATAPVSVAVTIRALGDETRARAALPFLVLFPGAVWVGASADGIFTGVVAAGLALLARPG